VRSVGIRHTQRVSNHTAILSQDFHQRAAEEILIEVIHQVFLDEALEAKCNHALDVPDATGAWGPGGVDNLGSDRVLLPMRTFIKITQECGWIGGMIDHNISKEKG